MDDKAIQRTKRSGRAETALNRYLIDHDLTDTAFARLVGVDQSFISRVARGHHFPRPDVALRIETVTAGAVTISHLAADYEQLRRAA